MVRAYHALRTSAAVAAAGIAASAIADRCPAAEPIVTVRTVNENEDVTGSLAALSLEKGVSVHARVESEPVRIPTPDVVSISFARSTVAPSARETTFELTGADRLTGTIAGSDDDCLVVETGCFGRVLLPLERLVTLLTPQAREPKVQATIRNFLDESRDEDAVLLTNGDTVRGLVVRIDGTVVNVETPGAEAVVPLSRLLAARLAGVSAAPTEGIAARMIAKNGDRLTVTRLTWIRDVDDGVFEVAIEPHADRRFAAAPDRLVRIDWIGGRWQRLSERAASRHEHIPMLALKWGFERDRNVLGGPIRIGGQELDHGIGVHSQSVLRYDLNGEYAQFVTSFGLDDDSGPYANVDVEICVDGRTRFARKNIVAGELHGPVRLDVGEAGHLELRVLFGENGSLQDRFNWADPALVR